MISLDDDKNAMAEIDKLLTESKVGLVYAEASLKAFERSGPVSPDPNSKKRIVDMIKTRRNQLTDIKEGIIKGYNCAIPCPKWIAVYEEILLNHTKMYDLTKQILVTVKAKGA